MPRTRTKGFTDREFEILSILWNAGEVSVEEIRERLTGNPSANTVRTLLTVMVKRGYVADDGKGYAKRYRALVDRSVARRSGLRRLIDGMFGGSTENMLMHLVDEGEMDVEQLQRLQKRLQQEGATP